MPNQLPDNNSYHVPPSAHDYYDGLTAAGKMQVWHEYYVRYQHARSFERPVRSPFRAVFQPNQSSMRSTDLAKRIGHVLVVRETTQVNSFFTRRGQLRSLGFGLVCGAVVILVFGFTLFNELVITPFIRPNQTAGQALVAVDQAGAPVDPSPKIRIPAINVEIPIVYGLTTTDDKQFQLALDNGVVHYPTTVRPGQAGNTAFFGHSSNNIFNPGKYKFAFVLLHQLVVNDKFYLTDEGKLYTYEVISRKVVKPTEIGVLGPVEGQVATATLITCDPPGTSNNRLIVVGKQISPDPAAGAAPVLPVPAEAKPQASDSLPGKAPSLLDRLWDSIF